MEKKHSGSQLKPFSFPHGITEVREINDTLESNSIGNLKIEMIAIDITMKNVMVIDSKKNRFCNSKNLFFLYAKIGYTKIDYSKRNYTSEKPNVIGEIDKFIENVNSMMVIV